MNNNLLLFIDIPYIKNLALKNNSELRFYSEVG